MIDDCTNCEFILGPCSGSLFIRDCSDLCVTAACMQLRLRDVNNADFFVHTETDPAVESSTFVTLRPLNMLQPNLANAFAEAKLKADENRFKHAADFNTFSDPKAKVGFTLPEWLGHLMMRSLDLEGHGVCNAPEGVAEMLAGAIEGGESLEKGNCFAMGVSAKEAMRQHEVRQGLRDEDDVSDDAGDKDSQSDSLTLDSDMVSGKSSKRGADPEPTPTPVTKPPAPSPEPPMAPPMEPPTKVDSPEVSPEDLPPLPESTPPPMRNIVPEPSYDSLAISQATTRLPGDILRRLVEAPVKLPHMTHKLTRGSEIEANLIKANEELTKVRHDLVAIEGLESKVDALLSDLGFA